MRDLQIIDGRMDMRKRLFYIVSVCILLLAGCASQDRQGTGDTDVNPVVSEDTVKNSAEKDSAAKEEQESEAQSPQLLYMGQASMRIVTAENKVIYIDPYAGDDYDLPADLVLVTHAHFDHSGVDKVQNKASDCQIITHEEAIQDGKHQTFELPYVIVEAVEAGYNEWHDVKQCVGYVLTFTNGKSIYVTGDTSTTRQMPQLAEKKIDYAFFCCDGVYNMGIKEAEQCSEMVGAKHSIPYHNSTSNTGDMFDLELAEQFHAENRMIVKPGEVINIE